MRRILIINPFGIGDVLFTTPVLGAIRRSWPGAFIGYWCNQRVEPLIKEQPAVNSTFALSRGDLKRISRESSWWRAAAALSTLVAGIRRARFDISLDFSLDHRYSLISKLAGIGRRIGFDYKGRGGFLTDAVPVTGYEGRHAVQFYNGLSSKLGIPAPAGGLELVVSAQSQLEADALLEKEGIAASSQFLVGIAPGAGESWGKDASVKQWPAGRFAELADLIQGSFKVSILLLGSAEERPLADSVENKMRERPLNLAGKTTLTAYAGIIRRLRLLVTNDGGPLHMAVALGVRTVSIFGPVDEKVYGPYLSGGEHRVITADVACRPCYRNFRFAGCTNQRRCIESITVTEVFNEVKKLL